MKETLKENSQPKWYTFHTQNRQPPQWCPSSPFITQGGKAVTKSETQNIPFHSMGIFTLILGRVRLMGLNSHSPHKLSSSLLSSYSHVDVHISAHHLYTLRILWCISSTLHFTYYLQMCHVHVQRCTFHFCSLYSVFLLWTKIFTTAWKV